MTWAQLLGQLTAWLHDPPPCIDGTPLGVVPIHVAIEYVKHAAASGTSPPTTFFAAQEGIHIGREQCWSWLVNHNGTVSAWEWEQSTAARPLKRGERCQNLT